MGAWGTGNFENDDALDWLFELTESADQTVLAHAFSPIGSEDYLEAPDCSIALAAAEVIASVHQGSIAGLPDEVRSWIEEKKIEISPDLVSTAAESVNKIKDSSELRELWEDSESHEEWLALVSDLATKLSAT